MHHHRLQKDGNVLSLTYQRRLYLIDYPREKKMPYPRLNTITCHIKDMSECKMLQWIPLHTSEEPIKDQKATFP